MTPSYKQLAGELKELRRLYQITEIAGEEMAKQKAALEKQLFEANVKLAGIKKLETLIELHLPTTVIMQTCQSLRAKRLEEIRWWIAGILSTSGEIRQINDGHLMALSETVQMIDAQVREFVALRVKLV